MAGSNKNGIFVFNNFSLDAEKLMLYRDGEEVLIPAKVAKTLVVLVESAGNILAKDELIDRVWEDSIVEESNLTQYLYLLRKTLGTMPDGRPYIETLRRRGYRFNGDVRSEAAPILKAKAVQQDPPHVTPQHSGVERDGNVLRVVDWQPAPAPHVEHPPGPSPSTGHPLKAAIVAVVLLAAAGAGVIYFWPNLMVAATTADAKREISITRLTNGAVPGGGTISPDGNYFVYHELDGDVVRMYVQQTGQTARHEIYSTADKVMFPKVFSPDGQFIYFTAATKGEKAAHLYRIPAMGGAVAKILENVSGPISFSPDGKEMVFTRANQPAGTTSLVIADRDGRTERVVLERKAPKILSTFPIWSPDGTAIVFGMQDLYTEGSLGRQRLHVLKVTTGEARELSPELWETLLRAAWLPDGKGFVVIATRDKEAYSTRRDQVYLISYPDGVSRRITADGNRYEPDSLGVTRDGAIFAIPGNRSSQIWTVAADGDASKSTQLTRGAADGRAGLGPMPDGRIGFLARTTDEINLLVSNADGTEAKQLATGFPFVEELRADPAGKFFLFSTRIDNNNHLFRVNSDGTGVKQLTSGDTYEIDSSISPDGQFVIYDSAAFTEGVGTYTIFRQPSAGGAAQALFKGCVTPTYSPDGSLISCVRVDKPEICIISATDGTLVETHPLPIFATTNFGVGWTRDGTGLIYIASEKEVFNLWIQPRDGSKPKRLTNFSSGAIYRYAFAPDYSKIYVARGYPMQDAVLIRNYR
ncbi:MAG TPA: winged helix-turn-helix domain-containing protein [Pyrinomonadaceae bacterium]|nr:winged helix-turn-helix domain-containing protein [Pyrinomonadaceae bacterium]